MRVRHYSIWYWLSIAITCLLMVGCATPGPQQAVTQTAGPTPTVAALFRESPTQTSDIAAASPTPLPDQPTISAPSPIPADPTSAVPTRIAEEIASIPLYDDALNSDWSAENSDKVRYSLSSTAFVHGGKAAIAVTPRDGFGRLFLTVRKNARKAYPRNQILGVRFWLGSGADTIATSDLAVTVVGSNQYAYWVANDSSVKIDSPITVESPLFSETRLYFLHINRAIPPHSWVEVVVWLDDLIYDPNYTNVTGMYIKNDQDFLSTYYIDDMQLLVQQ